jgi:hypothetical protein
MQDPPELCGSKGGSPTNSPGRRVNLASNRYSRPWSILQQLVGRCPRLTPGSSRERV